ncbi:MAG: type II toxin-antitoxin system RelE/ParE family toxin [Verrucomicrobiae bacterium]
MKIRVLDLAERDLQAGFYFYEALQPGIGDYFLDAMYAEIDSLFLYAGIHKRVFGYHRQVCRRFPYAIYYNRADDEISVWRVLDLRRDPTWIADQLRTI